VVVQFGDFDITANEVTPTQDGKPLVRWVSRKTGLSASRLWKYGFKTWYLMAILARVGRPDLPKPYKMAEDYRQSTMKFFEIDERGAAHVSDKLRDLLELSMYLDVEGPGNCRLRPLCNQGILSVAACKAYEKSQRAQLRRAEYETQTDEQALSKSLSTLALGRDLDFRAMSAAVVWASRVTGIPELTLEQNGYSSWFHLTILARLARPDLPAELRLPVPDCELRCRYLGITQEQATEVSERLRELLDLAIYLRCIEDKATRSHFTKACDKNIFSVESYIHGGMLELIN
jgi:hypothetical protein